MNTNIQIRNAQLEDAEIIADGWVRSIRQMCAPAYNNNSQLVETWIQGKTPECVKHIIATDDIAVVALIEGKIAGIGFAKFELEKAACYVWPEYVGRGAGRAIIKSIEECALGKGVENFAIHASFNAVGFYQKLGYKATGQVLYYDGIGCIVMTKSLHLKPAYFLAQVQEITDKDAYMEYVRQVPATVKEFGGRYMSRGEARSIIGEKASMRTLLIEFHSEEHIKRWFTSEQYRKLAPLREKSTKAAGYILNSCCS
jgi:uncharacterized protein (DUF1330 family)/GNAT superfamily N-acetyltransferase